MKWSIVGLFLLGVAAAVCASILVVTMRAVPPAVAKTRAAEDVQIMVAAKPMRAMSIVDARAVITKTVPADEAPQNGMRRPTDVIGRLLMVPIVEGQVLTSACFADEKSGARLASALANGMRAVSVSLKPEKAGLLYPGCIVDVLVSLNRPSTEGPSAKEAMSMTLLQSVEVLAIDDVSVMSDSAFADPPVPETNATPRRERRDRLVTLMVNSNQAKALQLAAQYGAVSLALRNPLDSAPVETDSTMLSDLADEYTRIVTALASQRASESQSGDRGGESANAPGNNKNTAGDNRTAVKAPVPENRDMEAPLLPIAAAGFVQKQEDPKWETLVTRGQQVEVVRFSKHGEFSPHSATSAMQWIWDGRALSSTTKTTK